MKFHSTILIHKPILALVFLVTLSAGSASADIVISTGNISVSQGSGGGFLAGTSTFNVTTTDIADVELLANFSIVDAGVEVSVNGTSLFPSFDDISQFGPVSVFTGTGIPNGGVQNPFSPNNNGLPRLTIGSTSAGTTFSGAETTGTNTVIPYTPTFMVQDFTSLLVPGQNTIEFFVLNSFSGANLQGDFTVVINEATTAVPEPSSSTLAFLALMNCLATRRRSA